MGGWKSSAISSAHEFKKILCCVAYSTRAYEMFKTRIQSHRFCNTIQNTWSILSESCSITFCHAQSKNQIAITSCRNWLMVSLTEETVLTPVFFFIFHYLGIMNNQSLRISCLVVCVLYSTNWSVPPQEKWQCNIDTSNFSGVLWIF